MSDQEKGPGSPFIPEQAAVHFVGAAGAFAGLGPVRRNVRHPPVEGLRGAFREALSPLPEDSRCPAKAQLEAADQGVARIPSSSTAQMQAAEKAVMPRRSAEIDQQVNEDLVPQDPGAQRPFPGSAQPHRRAHLPDRNLQQRSQQGLPAQADRGAEERSPQGQAAGRRRKSRQ